MNGKAHCSQKPPRRVSCSRVATFRARLAAQSDLFASNVLLC